MSGFNYKNTDDEFNLDDNNNDDDNDFLFNYYYSIFPISYNNISKFEEENINIEDRKSNNLESDVNASDLFYYCEKDKNKKSNKKKSYKRKMIHCWKCKYSFQYCLFCKNTGYVWRSIKKER